MFKENTNYFYAVRVSISLAILSVILIKIDYFLLELCKKTKVAVFSEYMISCSKKHHHFSFHCGFFKR